MYRHTYVYLYAYIRICIHTYISISTYIYIYTYIHIHVYICVCVCVCVCVSVCVCMRVCIHTLWPMTSKRVPLEFAMQPYIPAEKKLHISNNIYTHTYIYACVHVYACGHIHILRPRTGTSALLPQKVRNRAVSAKGPNSSAAKEPYISLRSITGQTQPIHMWNRIHSYAIHDAFVQPSKTALHLRKQNLVGELHFTFHISHFTFQIKHLLHVYLCICETYLLCIFRNEIFSCATGKKNKRPGRRTIPLRPMTGKKIIKTVRAIWHPYSTGNVISPVNLWWCTLCDYTRIFIHPHLDCACDLALICWGIRFVEEWKVLALWTCDDAHYGIIHVYVHIHIWTARAIWHWYV